MRRDRVGSNSSTSFGDLRLDRLLADFSFLRISIDHITTPTESPFLARLQQRGSIYGYTLKYSFPCPDGVSSSLRHKVVLRASSFTSNAIFFRHKRVNLVKLNPDVIPFWSRAHLILDLEVQLNAQGKYSTRPLARCTVPLEDLLLPPFAVSRDFDFLGANFEGSALIRIDLGSKQRSLMERLERWRGELDGGGTTVTGVNGPDATFTVPPAPRHTRSRSSSRCRSHSSDGGAEDGDDDDVFIDVDARSRRRGVSPFRERLPSNGSQPSSTNGGPGPVYARPVATTRSATVSSFPSMRDTIKRALKIRLFVHSASGLPMTRDARGLLVAPSAFISVRGRDGEMRSPARPASRSPRFDWSCTFHVSGERRNIVVKVLHSDSEGNDVPLGFVSLPLPMANVTEADYELVDLSGGNMPDAAMITLSVDVQTSSRPPSTLDAFAPVPVASGPPPIIDDYYGGHGPANGHRTRAASYDPLIGNTNDGQRTQSRSSASSSMALSGGMSRQPRPGSRSRKDDEYAYRARTPSPDVTILDSREEIENRLRRNMGELDILMARLDRS